MFKCAIFDLDGVIVDTAKYHYLAWYRLANNLGVEFTAEDNELLKGVSRADSLNIILDLGGVAGSFSPIEKYKLAECKNRFYLKYIETLSYADLLPGVESLLLQMRERGIKTAIGSSSKNAILVLEKLGIKQLFDAIVDGNMVDSAKPSPMVFTLGAERCGVSAQECVVFEDAAAGVEAARNGGMLCIGIGTDKLDVDIHFESLEGVALSDIISSIK